MKLAKEGLSLLLILWSVTVDVHGPLHRLGVEFYLSKGESSNKWEMTATTTALRQATFMISRIISVLLSFYEIIKV